MGFAVELIDEAQARRRWPGLELMGTPSSDRRDRAPACLTWGSTPMLGTGPSRARSCSRATPSRPTRTATAGRPTTAAFFEYGVAGADDRGLRALAQQFAGAWPYLQLIASATGLDDPLDRRVVEAYWVGSPRLDQVGTPLGRELDGGPLPVR